MFSKQNRGLWECAFCTPLYTLTGKEKNEWQDSTLCMLPLGHEKTQLSASFPWGMKKQKTTLCHRDSGPVGFLGFLGFRVFFVCFFCFLVFFVFCSFFGFPTFPWDQFLPPEFVVSVSTCRHEGTLGQQENWILERDLSELKNQNCFVFFGWLGFKPIFNFLNSKA